MAMSAYHKRIMDIGIDEAKRQAKEQQALREVNSAYEVLTDTSGNINFVHAGFAMSSIPHRATKDTLWERVSGAGSKLRLEAGLDHQGINVGLPYGLLARYILLYLQTYASRTRSREILLGDSMYDYWRDGDLAGRKNLPNPPRAIEADQSLPFGFLLFRFGSCGAPPRRLCT